MVAMKINLSTHCNANTVRGRSYEIFYIKIYHTKVSRSTVFTFTVHLQRQQNLLEDLGYWIAQVRSRQLGGLKMGTEHQLLLQLEWWLRQREERAAKRRARQRGRGAVGGVRERPTVVSMCLQASGSSPGRTSTHS